ncbi:hypothetical protein GW17_00027848 [Ensete ventricosum]|nr:hypothetical protein GW17_00027848 [Ensete ventricosum]RZS24410.1 hypothetical protein BHM03_00057475 [Ensete ventricosum]
MALFMAIIETHTRNCWFAAHVSNVAIGATVDSTQKVTPCGPFSVSKHNSASVSVRDRKVSPSPSLPPAGKNQREEASKIRSRKGMEEGGIVEETSSARTVRWVDGSEVDSESPPWSIEEEALVLGPELQATLRRRLVKKAPSVDSLDVEAMDIADAHKRREKVPFRAAAGLWCSVPPIVSMELWSC